jgi:hypothetical protein
MDAPVLEGVTVLGDLNVPMTDVMAHIQHAIRQGHPQVRVQDVRQERVVLVGSGPSLAETEGELRDLVYAGAKIVTMNAGYHWCLARNFFPSAQIVLDAKPSTARFLEPAIPRCKYFAASQCHPAVWAVLKGRPLVYIWHSLNPEHPEAAALDTFYGEAKNWCGIVGGTTVATRAIMLLRTLGFLKFDLFGVDSCWLDDQHHALDQPENQRDRCLKLTITPSHSTQAPETFLVAPWHIKQLEDVLLTIRTNGQHFVLNVHGRGLVAAALRMGADVSITTEGV